MKSHTQTFIEDAIAGGWEKDWWPIASAFPNGYGDFQISYGDCFAFRRLKKNGEQGRWVRYYGVSQTLLDPSAWQAVGKTRGWKRSVCRFDTGYFQTSYQPSTPNGPEEWFSSCNECGAEELDYAEFPEGNVVEEFRRNMHRFIDALADGDDIDTALGKIQTVIK